jgi:hypothetical protein
MADITDQHDQTSPTELDDAHAVGNGTANEGRGVKRPRAAAEDDDDDDEKGGRERRKIEIKFISDKSRRHITFSKRKAGIMKKVRVFCFCSDSLCFASRQPSTELRARERGRAAVLLLLSSRLSDTMRGVKSKLSSAA